MPKKYDPEFRERALRMLDEARPGYPTLMAAIRHVSGLLGMNAALIGALLETHGDAARCGELDGV